ncbi:response regulator transcription factor [uncultured Sphaerochaeta sp.]|uniref:response regulator transcription factor n=1 Tax=uncultured Sphaerochaeta sp. TaxID=886478 RepID=UPI002A0A6B9A|nr:response regulator transcription factor [uncultured Sphaerochaeta sp.]
MPQKIFVADDEPKMVDLIKKYLEVEGYSVLTFRNGSDLFNAYRKEVPDCLILDINMPGMDGLSLAREVRKTSDTPIIFLSARTDEIDRIVGFEMGADDYITKPFSPREMVARVKAILRRKIQVPASPQEIIVEGTLSMDIPKRTVSVGDTLVELTAAQFDILVFMMQQPGRVWSRLDLLGSSTGSSFEGYERTIDAHIKNIRKALGDDSDNPRFIETVRGIGYRFREQDSET